jgi:hypothetical protein
MCAFAVHSVMGNLSQVNYNPCLDKFRVSHGIFVASVAVVVCISCARAMYNRFFVVDTAGSYYGILFSELNERHIDNFLVIHGGVGNSENITDYDPQFRFYKLLWETKGLEIYDARDRLSDMPNSIPVAVTCDDRYRNALLQRGTVIVAVRDCVAVSLKDFRSDRL